MLSSLLLCSLKKSMFLPPFDRGGPSHHRDQEGRLASLLLIGNREEEGETRARSEDWRRKGEHQEISPEEKDLLL